MWPEDLQEDVRMSVPEAVVPEWPKSACVASEKVSKGPTTDSEVAAPKANSTVVSDPAPEANSTVVSDPAPEADPAPKATVVSDPAPKATMVPVGTATEASSTVVPEVACPEPPKTKESAETAEALSSH